MNKLTKKKTNKIIIVLVIMLLCNFAIPNYVHASVGGLFFKPIAQFIAHMADLVLQGLQKYFVGDGTIAIYTDNWKVKYVIKYSPGKIFSGMVPALDTNFIRPKEDVEVTTNVYHVASNRATLEEAADSAIPIILSYFGIQPSTKPNIEEVLNQVDEYLNNEENWSNEGSATFFTIEETEYTVYIQYTISGFDILFEIVGAEDTLYEERAIPVDDPRGNNSKETAKENVKAWIGEYFREDNEENSTYDEAADGLRKQILDNKSYFENLNLTYQTR